MKKCLFSFQQSHLFYYYGETWLLLTQHNNIGLMLHMWQKWEYSLVIFEDENNLGKFNIACMLSILAIQVDNKCFHKIQSFWHLIIMVALLKLIFPYFVLAYLNSMLFISFNLPSARENWCKIINADSISFCVLVSHFFQPILNFLKAHTVK